MFNTKIQIFDKYPLLFHKYLLSITDPSDAMQYVIIQENTSIEFLNNHLFAHIHCYCIDTFNDIFGSWIDRILSYCSTVITYCQGTIKHNNTMDRVTLIKIPNRGMDIGGKFIFANYLAKRKINYKYALFLHSKTDIDKRKSYIDPLVDNLDKIHTMHGSDQDNIGIGCYVPPIILCGSKNIIMNDKISRVYGNISKNVTRNTAYMSELSHYMGLNPNNHIFPEGNCYMLKKSIVDVVFTDMLLYNVLNTPDTFDASWVKNYCIYELKLNIRDNIYDIYDFYKKNNIFPNCMASRKQLNQMFIGICIGDGMIEHCFERIIFAVIEKLHLKMHILPSSKNTDVTYIHRVSKLTAILNLYLEDKTYINFL